MKNSLFIVFIVLLGVTLVHFPALAQGNPGEWTQAGTLNQARSGHTVTPLPDGRLLVTGGHDGSEFLATAEIYDPLSEQATLVASSLATPRMGHRDILLKDGRILFIGGQGADGALDSAEAFDALSETFVSVEAMNLPRFNHTATLLPDGQVLIVGGNDGVGPLPLIEIFDPNSNAFILLETVLLEARESHTATLLKDGRVLVAGGSDAIGALATTEYIDPAALSIEPGPVLTEPRYGHTATRLMSGNVVLVYGTDGTRALDTAEILAPDFNDVFMIVNNLNDPNLGRYNHVAVLLPQNGNLLLLGGYAGGGVPDSSAELLNPSTGEFTPFTGMQNARADFGAVADDGFIWTIGGAGPNETPLADVETLQYATLVTDQTDYLANSDVTFTGSGWLPGEIVEIMVRNLDDDLTMTLAALADEDGNILNQEFNVGPDNAGVSFLATATGTTSAQTAFATFFDPPPPPTISSLSPESFTATDTDVTLTISGAYLWGPPILANRVSLSGPGGVYPDVPIVSQDTDAIVVTIPSSAANWPGDYTIRVWQIRQQCGYSYSKCGTCCYTMICIMGYCTCIETGPCPCCWTVTCHSNDAYLTITPENQPPVAVCQDVTVSAGPDCTADASIDDGSYDPDGDPITLTQDPPGPYGLGDTTVTLTVTDDSGESDSCQATVTVIDTTPPVITCPANVIASTDPGVCQAAGVDLGEPQTSDNCGAVTVSNDAPSVLPKGDTVVTWTATDASGNTASCQQTVTIVDTEPPAITCPADVSVPTNPGVCQATGVVLGSPTVSDNCPGVAVSSDAPSVFPKGDTVVTWTATDASGNTATCLQTVTVIDTEPPTISCPTDVTLECPADTSVAANGSATASDNCPGVTITYSDEWTPACGNTGTLKRTWMATDASGNSSTCVQIITVVDTTPPVFTTVPQDMTVQRDGNGNLTELNAWLASLVEADDACGNVTITDDFTSFPYECGNTGSVTVTWTAEDECGNKATTSATFTIEDPTAAVTYNGDMLLSTGGAPTVNANLIAMLQDNMGNVPDIDGEEVTFTLTAEGVGTIVQTVPSIDGVANAVVSLEPAIYMTKVTLGCSDFTASAIIVVYNPEGGFATGGGWLLPVYDGLNTHPGVRANFGFNARYKKGDPTGHIEFRYSDGYIDLKSSSIEQLVITGGKLVQFKGLATVNGVGGNWLFVKAIDNGEPGTNDTFEIKIWFPGVSPEGEPSERAGGTLQGGNILVHTKTK